MEKQASRVRCGGKEQKSYHTYHHLPAFRFSPSSGILGVFGADDGGKTADRSGLQDPTGLAEICDTQYKIRVIIVCVRIKRYIVCLSRHTLHNPFLYCVPTEIFIFGLFIMLFP